MTTPKSSKLPLTCDNDNDKNFMESMKSVVNEIRKFNMNFLAFLDDEKKATKELLQDIKRYNDLNS